jgi:hypothetical protein
MIKREIAPPERLRARSDVKGEPGRAVRESSFSGHDARPIDSHLATIPRHYSRQVTSLLVSGRLELAKLR